MLANLGKIMYPCLNSVTLEERLLKKKNAILVFS